MNGLQRKRSAESVGNQKEKFVRLFNEEYGVLGIIESISLQNFMCHENLKFDFHPHMNFIIGQNGSGKSAILTGIILALGGKSSATGRYANLKGFIKTDKQTSIISVTLKNCGPYSYKPEVYGEKIVVERVIHSSGSAQYKIKSSKGGHIISQTREELRNILESHGIQIENPTCVLTQEISRNFLLSKNSKMLFKLFYEGTNLKKVEDEYQTSIKHKNDTQLEIQNKKMLLPDMEKEVKRLKTYLENSEKIPDYKNELLWAGVIEMETRRDLKKQEYEKSKQNLMAIKEKLSRCKKENTEVNREMTKITKDLEECKNLISQHRNDLSSLNLERDKVKTAIREYQGSFDRHLREIRRRNDEISTLENSINEIRQKNEYSVNKNKKILEEEIKKLNEEISIQQQHLDNVKEEARQSNEMTNSLQQEMESLNECIQNLNNKILVTEKEYTLLYKGVTDELSVYGPEMKNVQSEIRKAAAAGLFRREPKGPIGLFIKVKNPVWNFAVQSILGSNLLKSFCCDNLQDSKTLSRILSQHYSPGTAARPASYTRTYLSTVYDVRAYKTKSSYPTLLDMLQIQDPVIANCLIDQKKIENLILIENAEEAADYIMRNPPKNCIAAYTLNGDKVCPNPYRFYFGQQRRGKMCLLKTIDEIDISNKKELLENLVKEKKEKEYALMLVKKTYDKCINDLSVLQSDIRSRSFKVKMKEKALEETKEKLNNYDDQTDVNGLLGDLDELIKERDIAEKEKTVLQQCLTAKKTELASININEKKDQLEKESSRFSELTQMQVGYEKKKANLDMKISKFESEVQNLDSSTNSLLKEYKHNAHLAELAANDAEEMCPRINTDRSPETVRKLLEELEKALEEEANCSKADLRQQYEEKYNKWIQSKRELEHLESVVATLHKMLELRKERFLRIRKNTALCLSLIFTTTLRKNKFDGQLEISYEDKELKIIAKPVKNSNKGNQNYHQLSGGERSFVTLAFLLTLWDRVEMPFRILDEYDVFMDSDNRHLSIGLLRNTAKNKKNVQYIFLSPLDLPPMDDSDSENVKVHKMPPPKRKRKHMEL